jgi:hypothetical protein
MEEAYQWILYLNPEESPDAFKLVKNAGLESFILLQDVRLANQQLPDWLSVLPALVNTHDRLAYRANACMEALFKIELPPEHMKRLAKMNARKNKWD